MGDGSKVTSSWTVRDEEGQAPTEEKPTAEERSKACRVGTGKARALTIREERSSRSARSKIFADIVEG